MNVAALNTSLGTVYFYPLKQLAQRNVQVEALPFSIKVLLESMMRNQEKISSSREAIVKIADGYLRNDADKEIAFMPSRVIMQDASGVPALVDLATLRERLSELGINPEDVHPEIPVDLIIDHSIQVDHHGSQEAFKKNLAREYERNKERYEFLKWAEHSFDHFRVVPPANGIIHQINLEYLSPVVHQEEQQDGKIVVYPDTLIGTDSHTTMINSLGVVGWGVGGIEAESVLMGIPITMKLPDVVGVRLEGSLREGVTATDVALTITELLRKHHVVGSFVEFFGEGLRRLSLPDRATIANMAPEYGATMGFFPIDEETISYLRMTGRSEDICELVEKYSKAQGLYYEQHTPEPVYKKVITLSLDEIEASVSGPSRPEERRSLSQLKSSFTEIVKEKKDSNPSTRKKEELTDGSIVIAAITSCTNTSNPVNMITAGLLAKHAVELGLKVPDYIQTSIAPGSKVVSKYLKQTGLNNYLEKLGFYHVGYGCTVCVGNTGELDSHIAQNIEEEKLTVASILSGNRNFAGRIHPLVKANYLASPPLVIAYAIAGKIDIDLYQEPLGTGRDGKPVYLKDIWPDRSSVQQLIKQSVKPELFKEIYDTIFAGGKEWEELSSTHSPTFSWNESSTYFKPSPFFNDRNKNDKDITKARALAVLGDSVTTDHISPVGGIREGSPASYYLKQQGVTKDEFNTYGARRGNDEVLMRGTFDNPRLKNRLVHVEGNMTKHFPSDEEMSIFEAAHRYNQEGTPLIILAGKRYGAGSARDWAAKGTNLLGVKTVIAESFERIHRSNLVMMGVLPLQFQEGESIESLHLTGEELFTIEGIGQGLQPGQLVNVKAEKNDSTTTFQVIVRLNTETEVAYFVSGGMFPKIIEKWKQKHKSFT